MVPNIMAFKWCPIAHGLAVNQVLFPMHCLIYLVMELKLSVLFSDSSFI